MRNPKGEGYDDRTWRNADAVAEFVEQHEAGAGKFWGATTPGDGATVELEAHDGSRMTVEYAEQADGSWKLGQGHLADNA